jgi:hypothetical protein
VVSDGRSIEEFAEERLIYAAFARLRLSHHPNHDYNAKPQQPYSAETGSAAGVIQSE